MFWSDIKYLILGGLGPYVSDISGKMSYPVLAIAVESSFIPTVHIHTLTEVTAKCVTEYITFIEDTYENQNQKETGHCKTQVVQIRKAVWVPPRAF